MKAATRSSNDTLRPKGALNAANRGLPFSLPLRFPERRSILFAGDILALSVAAIAAVAVWTAFRPDASFSLAFVVTQANWLAGLSTAWLLLYAALGAYDLRLAIRPQASSRKLVVTALTLGVAYPAAFFVFSKAPTSLPALFSSLGDLRLLRMLPVLFIAFAFVAEFAWRSLYPRILTSAQFQRRTIIVGAGWAGQSIASVVSQRGDGSYDIVGFVDDDPAKLGKAVPLSAVHAADGGEVAQRRALYVLGDRFALKVLIAQHGVSTLVLAISHEVGGDLLATLMDCLELGIDIIPMSLLYEQLTGRVPVEHIGDDWYVSMPLHHRGTDAIWPLGKRLMDIVLASLGMLGLAVLFPFIALAIYVDSPGPIFYSQDRVGKGGRVFRLHKFRSMVIEAERDAAQWAQSHDPRVTHVGRLLRRTHLDELPQFLNILKGDMSLVGPRPERPEFVARLAEEIPFYRVRHAVKPGAAGWALIKQGYGASANDALLKLQYDLYYVKHQSLRLDLAILLAAALDALRLRGR